jgi:hypothetical protein
MSTYNQSPARSRALGPHAELALVAIIKRDLVILAKREASEELEEHDAACAKMRERALAREASRRSQRAACPPAKPRRAS